MKLLLQPFSILCLTLSFGCWATRRKKALAAAVVQPPRLEMSQQLLLLSALAGNVTFTSFLSQERGAAQGYDYYRFFNAEPSQAVVVGTHGYCFVGFRGATASVPDLLLTLLPGMTSVCGGDGDQTTWSCSANRPTQSESTCCDVRTPYDKEYNAPYRQEMEDSLQECLDIIATPCPDEYSCLVLTGFSQGAAIAGVASLYLHSFQPRVITFGEPTWLGKQDCPLARTQHWYRYVNTWNDYFSTGSIGYDALSVFPLAPGTRQVGHMILFPSKKPFDNTTSSGLAYLGLDREDSVWKLKPMSLGAHDIVESTAGYLCSQDSECKSGRCQRRLFQPKVCT